MTDLIQPADFGFFSTLVSAGSLTAAARELGLTPAAVSKRLAQMEKRLQVPLLNRTTRRMMLTPEGEVYLENARRILDDITALSEQLGGARDRPTGLLRVNATLGFGRNHIAPLISRFVSMYPDVSVRLQLSVAPPPLVDDVYDVCVRFGEPPDARVIARKLAPNKRLLCATPRYLAKHGVPRSARDLTKHRCITIRQGDEAYGIWRLTRKRKEAEHAETVRINGPLTTNDGEVAVKWALEDHGILMRAEWDIREYLGTGQLVPILPEYATPPADIYAVYAQRHQLSTRIRTFVDFLERGLKEMN